MPLRPHAQRLLSPWALMALGLFAFSLPLQLNSQVVVPDSSQLHERVRKAQREFEFFHRDHLPHTAYLPQGRCDEYVGRLCLTGNDLTWNPSPEASTIVEAREVLLAELAEVNETLPGDHWVLGQRIRYLGDMGRWEEAMAIAEECQHPGPWWCQALKAMSSTGQGRWWNLSRLSPWLSRG